MGHSASRTLRSLTCGLSANITSSSSTLSEPVVPTHYIIAYEGNIGAGKTQILTHHPQLKNIEILLEPDFDSVNGVKPLTAYYRHPRKYATTVQFLVAAKQARLLKKPFISKIRFLERSPDSSRNIFIETGRHFGLINKIEYECLHYTYEDLIDNCPLLAIVYLRTKPKTCQTRIANRNSIENITKFTLLDVLNTFHDNHYKTLMPRKHNKPAIIVVEAEDEKQKVQKLLDKFHFMSNKLANQASFLTFIDEIASQSLTDYLTHIKLDEGFARNKQ